MTDALIYDHVRTPRGRGKPDGSLHTATTLHLAATALRAIKDRNHLDPTQVDDVVMGCVDPVGEAGGDIARMGALAAGFGDERSRRADQPLLRVRPRQRQFRRGADHGRPARHDDRRRRRIDEPRRHRRGGRRLAGRPSLAIPAYFMPQGVSADLIATKYGFSRDDVDAYAVNCISAPRPPGRRAVSS